jgi:hypothetical protein
MKKLAAVEHFWLLLLLACLEDLSWARTLFALVVVFEYSL